MAEQSVAHEHTRFADLLRRAVTEPGMISAAYSAFHGFSLGNQLLAAVQCAERGLPLGPLATFPGWKSKGRHVKRGERALWLWLPITHKREVPRASRTDDDCIAQVITRFVLK